MSKDSTKNAPTANGNNGPINTTTTREQVQFADHWSEAIWSEDDVRSLVETNPSVAREFHVAGTNVSYYEHVRRNHDADTTIGLDEHADAKLSPLLLAIDSLSSLGQVGRSQQAMPRMESQAPDSLGTSSIFNRPIPEVITLAQESFSSDLPSLLESHQGKWVMYCGKKQIAFADSKLALYDKAREMQLTLDDFCVFAVEPGMDDPQVEVLTPLS